MDECHFLPQDKSASGSHFVFGAEFRRLANGKIEVAHWSTAYFFCFGSNSIKQLVSSFSQATPKFSVEAPGIVCIEATPGDLDLDSAQCYVQLLGLSLAKRVWGGGENQRVGVIGVLAGPIRTPAFVTGIPMLTNMYQAFYLFGEHAHENDALAELAKPLGCDVALPREKRSRRFGFLE